MLALPFLQQVDHPLQIPDLEHGGMFNIVGLVFHSLAKAEHFAEHQAAAARLSSGSRRT